MENKDLPAYPQPITECGGAIHETGDYNFCAIGLTKRELIAAMALQGIITANHSKDNGPTLSPDVIALCAARYADALLLELSKTQP